MENNTKEKMKKRKQHIGLCKYNLVLEYKKRENEAETMFEWKMIIHFQN